MSQEPLKNFRMVGGCYDILHVDPLDLTARSARFERAFEYGEVEDLPDQRASKPEVMDYLAAYGGGHDKSVSELSNSYDFQTALKQEGSLEVADPTGALFSATLSGSFDQLRQSTTDSSSILTYASERVSRYRLRMNAQTVLQGLTGSLESALLSLPASEGPEYQKFLDRFGTHYLAEALFGGRATQRISVSKQDYVDLVQEGVNVSDQAGLTLELVRSKESASRQDKRDRRFTRTQSLTVSSVVYVGGYPQEYLDMWAMNVPEEPMPIQGRFEPLYSLLTTDYFPDSETDDLAARAELLEKATNGYLRGNGYDVAATRIKYGDTVRVATAQDRPSRELTSHDPDRLRTSRPGPSEATAEREWRLLDPVSPDSTAVVEFGRPLALRSAADTYLDAAAGTDGTTYLRGDGLAGCTTELGDSATWTLEIASGADRAPVVDGDLVVLRSRWTDRRGRHGRLLAETDADDPDQRVYSIGSDRQPGTVWALHRTHGSETGGHTDT